MKKRPIIGGILSKEWTKSELDYLTLNYKNMLHGDIAKQLGRSLSSIRHKTCRLGLISYDGKAKIRNVNNVKYWYIIKNRKPLFIHNILIEKYIGRKMYSYEVVHHKDLNSLNNKKENLILMTISEHMKLHYAFRNKNSKGQFC